MPNHINHNLPRLLLASVCASLLLAGCAAELVSGDDKLIIVKARPSQMPEATDVAETQCQKRGLHARLTRRVADNQYGFDCVR